MTSPQYPHITVQLLDKDGNAWGIIAGVSRKLRDAGVPAPKVEEYNEEAMAGDYNNLLRVTMEWVEVS